MISGTDVMSLTLLNSIPHIAYLTDLKKIDPDLL